MKRIYQAGDRVTHKGHLWTVVYEDCGRAGYDCPVYPQSASHCVERRAADGR